MDLKSTLNFVKGKTIAIVYIFEKEKAEGYKHFYIWKNEIITNWINAVYELNCIPYIMDLRTFMYKASNNSLPKIDLVLNLNNGCLELSTMSLVPSICAFLHIPCVPCNSISILSCENKLISNYIVRNTQINVPADINNNDIGIYRPKAFGNSTGIKIGKSCNGNGVFQEFIPGYDITIPFLFNSENKKIEAMPSTIYLPHTLDPNWIYNEETKFNDKGFKVINIEIQDKSIIDELLKILDILEVNTFARIDAQIKTANKKLSENINTNQISLDNFFFIEINAMPTIEIDDGFDLAFHHILNSKTNSFYNCAKEYINNVNKPTINGFVLLNSIISLITSKY